MEVKVGQIWKNKAGDRIEIIGLDGRSAALKMTTGEIGCHPISFLEWLIQQLGLVSDQSLSDLEIVQKALEETGFELEYFSSGNWWIHSTGTIGQVVRTGTGSQSLLTWAKQTIGVE